MSKKEFFINTVRMIDVEGSTNIPTVLYYRPRASVLIGSSALAEAKNRYEINEDFKIDLGNIDPKSEPPKKFDTATGERVSARKLTHDFLHEVLKYVSEWLENNDVAKGTSILLAEPLVMQTELVGPDWLSNYRRNLERILDGKFEKIDFLPEPFAVFQYYRYGLRHPLVAERTKHYALVMDFGGGTFDVCIIETTKEGDISRTGSNSMPLAASSGPIGGFYVNRMIAQELFWKYLLPQSRKDKFNKGLEVYGKWRKGIDDLSTAANEYCNFVNNFHETIYRVENPKLTLCKSIVNWGIESLLTVNVPIALPEDPFSATGKFINVQFSGSELRNIFVSKVWEPRLKHIIRQALQRGKEELCGAPISVVLLSGGSANIGWLRELLQRDFAGELGDAEILRLPDFQEVVTKGLAVECARRFHNQGGDFSSVTYNRLCLILDADRSVYQPQCFRARVEGLPNVTDMPGVLLPSASILRSFIDKPMRWRVKLDHPPRQQLDYYFLRSSFDPNDHENLQNIEEHIVYTPLNCPFDAALQVELIVKHDGTAMPTFIYKSGRTEAETIALKGKPFYLDMTYTQTAATSKAYIGLDFGTSNTSISFVDESSIQIYRKRAVEKSWKELSDLVSTLPYPLAVPLALYLSQVDQAKLVKQAFEFIEAALTMAAYVAYLDFCLNKTEGESRLFKGFTQRSAGPLWALINDCLSKLGNNAVISCPFQELLNPEFHQPLNDAVTFFASYKHGKVRETELDILRVVQILANISQKVFATHVFGFFENVSKQRFGSEHHGIFRHACGPPPFFKFSQYRGPYTFSEDEPFLLNLDKCTALPLQPLIFWDRCNKHPDVDIGHCYLFDIPEKGKGQYSFKAVGYPCSCQVSVTNQYRALAEKLEEYRERDSKATLLQVGSVEDILGG